MAHSEYEHIYLKIRRQGENYQQNYELEDAFKSF